MIIRLIFLFLFFAFCTPSVFAQETVPAEQQIAPAQSGSFETAMQLYRQKRYNEAIAEFQKVVEADPNNAAAYYMMGYAHYVLDHHADALAAFEKAFAADPAFDPRPYFRR